MGLFLHAKMYKSIHADNQSLNSSHLLTRATIGDTTSSYKSKIYVQINEHFWYFFRLPDPFRINNFVGKRFSEMF